MLVGQHWESDGPGVAAVVLTNRLVANVRNNDDCHTGILLGNDGVLSTIQNNGGFSAVIGEWLVFGVPADYYVQHTIISGNLQTEPPSGWNQLNVSRVYESVQTFPEALKATDLFLEIAEDAAGAVIVATATYNLTAEVFTGN